MNALVVYDSLYGNTEKVAQAIASAIGSGTKLLPVGKIKASDLKNLKLLIVGSPTHGGKPKQSTSDFLKNLTPNSLIGVEAAAFDTRLKAKSSNPFMANLLRRNGYASPKIARLLRSKGASIVAAPKGFVVREKEGPLRKGELERAREWARLVAHSRVHHVLGTF